MNVSAIKYVFIIAIFLMLKKNTNFEKITMVRENVFSGTYGTKFVPTKCKIIIIMKSLDIFKMSLNYICDHLIIDQQLNFANLED